MSVQGGLGKGHGRRLRALRGIALVVAVGVAMLGGITVTATSALAGGNGGKSWVCKYTGNGVETLKPGGDGLVWVHTDVPVGEWFVDNQENSYVLAFSTPANTRSPGHTYTGSDKCPLAIVDVPTLTVTTAASCDAPGSVDATNTDYYTWAPSGTSDARYYTATPIGNVRLVGVIRQGPFNLSQLTGSQCPVTPPSPPAGLAPTTPTDPARITLSATVENHFGGKAKVSNFTLTATGIQTAHAAAARNSFTPLAVSGTTPLSFSGKTGDAAITNAELPAGTYSLSESALPQGYSKSAWVCTGGGQNGAEFTVGSGQKVSCNIFILDSAASVITTVVTPVVTPVVKATLRSNDWWPPRFR